MDIGIGSVVYYKDSKTPSVITGMKCWEDVGSCAYSREYYIMPLAEIQNREFIQENEGLEIRVHGATKLPFTIIPNIAPFKIIEEKRYRVEQKKAKTITIYE